jgi:hypothetical protein
MRDIIIDGLRFAAVSSLFIALGLRLLLARKPFIVSLFWYSIIWITPVTAFGITSFLRGYPAQCSLLDFVAIGCLAIWWTIVIVLLPYRGGFITGTTRTELRDALRHALHRLSLPYEESARAFRLPTLNNELVVKATGFNGIFTLHLKRLRNRRAIRQLVTEINDFFRTAPAQINKRLGYGFVVIGAVFLLFYSWLTYKQFSLQAKMRATRETHQNSFRSSEK